MAITKQEAQALFETTKKQIIEKVATRHDVQILTEAARDRVLNYVRDLLQIYQQNLLRRAEFYQIQTTRRISAMETRMMSMEQEVKAMRQVMERLADQAPQRIYMPLQPEKGQAYTKYVYKPA